MTFFLEGLNPTLNGTASAPTVIAASADLGDGRFGLDEVRVTVVDANLGVNNSNSFDTLRPGVPDADFLIDEFDEMAEDQGDPYPDDDVPGGGYTFWRGRIASSLEEAVTDYFPVVVDVPLSARALGFRAYLRLVPDHVDEMAVLPNPSALDNLIQYLSVPAVFAALNSTWSQDLRTLATEDLPIELTGDRTSFLVSANPVPSAPPETNLRLELVVEDRKRPDHSDATGDGVLVDSVLLTIRKVEGMFWIGTARTDDPSFPFAYTTEANNDGSGVAVTQTVSIYPPFVTWVDPADPAPPFRSNPARADHVVYIHGYNEDESDSIADSKEVFRRLFWAGYRGNFLALLWEGDEWDLPGPLPSRFFPNVENAFRTSPRLESFLSATLPDVWSADPHHVYLLVHSLGNLVAWDALRLRSTMAPGAPPIVRHIVSFQAAVWSDTFWDETNVMYEAGPWLTVEELRLGAWTFWFNQAGHPAAASTERVVNSFVEDDSVLGWMRWNEIHALLQSSPRLERCLQWPLPSNQRVPVSDGLDADDPGNRPDLAYEIPALLDRDSVPACSNIYVSEEALVPPLGQGPNPLETDYSFDAYVGGFGWRYDKHNDYVERSLPEIWGWYAHLLNPQAPGFEPEGILPRDRE